MAESIAQAALRGARPRHHDVVAIYDELTDGLTRPLRVAELVYAAAERYPDLLPTRAAIDGERSLPQKDKAGLEIAQGSFVAQILARPREGRHLLHAMAQPRPEALAALDDFHHRGCVDLGPMRVDRDGSVGRVTIQNRAGLNTEDEESTSAMEIAVDLVLLDDAIEVGVLRAAPATHPRHAGRRVFGTGVDLARLYDGQIALVEYMLERELGVVSKLYRGHDLGVFDDPGPELRREKPWIAAVDSFALGGACQWLLVMDRVIAETGSYFTLPARREGLVSGCANLRLSRFVGERLARQAIFFGRTFRADRHEGRLIADEVLDGHLIDKALRRAADELASAGSTAVLANRRALRVAAEPLDAFRRYMSTYAREQARCLYSPALIDTLERSRDRDGRIVR